MLSQGGHSYQERLYFKQAPTVAEVQELAAKLPGGARDLLSTKSRRYKELGLDVTALSDAEVALLLAQEPGLWRRPVVVVNGQVLVQPKAEVLAGL